MLKNNYWLLISKSKKSPSQLVIELTPDGMAYVWPAAAALPKQYLPFEKDQDPEALQADGDFLDKSGFYHGITDFMSHSKYPASLYNATFIGEFDSIRSCRLAMHTAL